MTTNGDVLIRVENLQKAFGDFHALNGITEEIHKGEVVVIIGPSGSGKSTFLRSLNLLEVPTGGLLTISNSFKYIKNQSRKICGLSIMISLHFPAHFPSIVSQNDYLFFLSSSNSFLRRSASTDILSARSFSLASFPSNSSIRILYLSNGSSIAPSNNGFISSHPPIS